MGRRETFQQRTGIGSRLKGNDRRPIRVLDQQTPSTGARAITGRWTMMDDGPTPMQVLLKVVEVVELQLRNAPPIEGSQEDRGRAIQIVNRIGPGSYVGAVIQESERVEMSGLGDQYTVGQAGAVGPYSQAHSMSFTQAWNQVAGNVDLTALKPELTTLRAAMKEQATDPEHDIAVAEIASAEVAAAKGDGPKVMEHLAKAGKWALAVATGIGTAIAATALKAALGL